MTPETDKREGSIVDLNRDGVLGAADRVIEPVDVPEWGGRLHIRSMTGLDRAAWETASDKAQNTARKLALLVQACVCDAVGNLLFSAADVPALEARNAKALLRVARAAGRLNGLTADDVEAIAKNCEAAPADDGG